MVRLSRLADYGIVLLSYFVRDGESAMHTARGLAAESKLPLPTVSKVLKALGRAGLLVSHRGVKGGYVLARPPTAISVLEILRAIEGPIALTECSASSSQLCDLEVGCPVRSNWQTINGVVLGALEGLTLASMTLPGNQEMSQPAAGSAARPGAGLLRVLDGRSP